MKKLLVTCALILMAPALGEGQERPALSQPADLKTAAKAVVELQLREDFAAIHKQFDANMKAAFTPEKLRATWREMARQLGAFKRLGEPQTLKDGPNEEYDVVMIKGEFERGKVNFIVAYNQARQISGLRVNLLAEEIADSARLKAAAKEVVDQLVRGEFTAVAGKFDGTMKAALPPEKLKEWLDSVSAQAGAYKRHVASQATKQLGFNVVDVRCEFERGELIIRVAFNQQQQIGGLYILPAQ